MVAAMDKAHKETDEAIAKLERRIKRIYREAQQDIDKKIYSFNLNFAVKDTAYRKQLKEGKITEAQYRAWLKGQVFQSKQWKSKEKQIVDTLTNANIVAQKIINGQVYGVFANNANWQSYSLEHTGGINFGFGLYDPNTVARLLKEQPKLLPLKQVDIPKDQRWSQAKITQQITQGIIQGEGIEDIAKRLRHVTGMEKVFSLTNARTAMTGAQNAGRQQSLENAKSMGIKVKKEWLATLDGHTRTQHRRLDGQKVDMDKPFKIDSYSIRFPGDPQAAPAMIYNCRCTMIGDLEDYPDQYNAQRYDNIDGRKIQDMTYQEWYEAKTGEKQVQPGKSKPVGKPVETVENSILDLVKPKRPRPRDFESDDAYQKAREEYREARKKYEDDVDALIEANVPKDAMTFDQLKSWADANDIDIYGSLDGVDMRIVTEWTKRYEKLNREFPVVRQQFDRVGKFSIGYTPDGDFIFEAAYGMDFGRSCYDAKSVLRDYYDGISDGYFVKGVGDFRALYDHEFGHNLMWAIDLMGATGSGDSLNFDPERAARFRHDISSLLLSKKGMSEYATTNENELFAEAFAEWHSGSDSDFAKAFDELLKRWLK